MVKKRKRGDVNISNRSRGGLYVFLRLAEGDVYFTIAFSRSLPAPPPPPPVLIMNGPLQKLMDIAEGLID